MAAVMMAHLQQPPPRVTDFVPTLPAGLDWVIATAMAKDVRKAVVQAYADVKALSGAAAEGEVEALERGQRYLQDVY